MKLNQIKKQPEIVESHASEKVDSDFPNEWFMQSAL